MVKNCRKVLLPLALMTALCYASAYSEPGGLNPGGATMEQKFKDVLPEWKKKAVEYARIMSTVKWIPVAGTMPNRRGGFFKEGTEYTGVPYSSVKSVGRYIGFDIYLKTFLAAVENPESVLYTESLAGKVTNAAGYYGKVCSSFTSYAFQCGYWYVSRLHNPPYREGIVPVDPQDAQAVEAGDFVYYPPLKPNGGSHVELITDVIKEKGRVTHVRIEDSWPPTTRDTLRTAGEFNLHIAADNRKVYRITDPDAWRGKNRADSFLFPNYAEDSSKPVINRVLLLDLGDWVPYYRGQAVKINVMDRDSRGVKTLLVRRGKNLVEEIPLDGPGIVERSFNTCGDYTALCVMKDGSESPACEFSVCDLSLSVPGGDLRIGEPWEVKFNSDNIRPILAYLTRAGDPYGCHHVWITEEDLLKGSFTVPANLFSEAGECTIWLVGENRYGRLKRVKVIMTVK